MRDEVNKLLDKLGKLEEAPLIWINKKVYNNQEENEKLHSIIKEAREKIEELAEDDGDFIGAIDRRRKVELLEILDKVDENK